MSRIDPRDRYDTLIQFYWEQAVDRYTIDYGDWKLLKALIKQESGFNPTAVSPVGAQGLGQLMPGTFGAIDVDRGIHPFNPEVNLQRTADHLGQQWSEFKLENGMERWKFALGSYNAGLGNILKAQLLAKSKKMLTDQWLSIMQLLPAITGPDNAAQTIDYVRKITATWMATRVSQ